ncbi:MAG: outer membrane beta-barrel protein [Erythrobacter sp.]
MRNLIAIVAPVVALAPSTALAQAAGPSPLERARPEFDPVGARIGSFELHPYAEAQGDWNSNVLARPEDEVDDTMLTLDAGLDVESLWRRHRVTARAYARQTIHGELTTEDVFEAGARVNGVYDISRETYLRGGVTADFLAEDRTAITNVSQAREPTRFRRFGATAALGHELGDFELTFDAALSTLDFDDAIAVDGTEIEQDFRDSIYMRGALTIAYDISPSVAAVVRGQVDRLDYTSDAIGPEELDRDTTGFAIEGGVRMQLTSLLFGEVRAGYLQRNSEDDRLPGASGLSFGANMQWDVTPLTTLRLFADRQVEESGSLFNSGNIRSQVRLVAEHELLRNLILDGELRLARIDSVGQFEEQADEYRVRAGVTYLANRRLRLFARFSRFERMGSEGFFRDFNANRASFGVRLVF